MTLYPHYLYVKKEGEMSVNELGDYEVTSPSWEYWGRCREEGNGSGSEIQTADMKSYKFSSTVYMPVGTRRITEGTTIAVTTEEVDNLDDGSIPAGYAEGVVRISGENRKFDGGRLHCRMWV